MAKPKRSQQPPEARKPLKTVFVIMPFTETPTRNEGQLTAFFLNEIKATLERGRFAYRYQVRRSDDTFNITEQIIRDLYTADVVICDLSGIAANPNVMYELGLRLAFSDRPVILIREAHKDNRQIFDIGGFYAQPYDPFDYASLRECLTQKIRKLESGDELYRSPVLRVVGEDQPLLKRLAAKQAARLVEALSDSLLVVTGMFVSVVISYVNKKAPTITLSPELPGVLSDLQKRAAELNDIDWRGFGFDLGSLPTIDHLIATRYLSDLLPDNIERLFTHSLIRHHRLFFAGDLFSRSWSAGMVYRFVEESAILSSAANAIMTILMSADDEDKTRRIADVERVLTATLRK